MKLILALFISLLWGQESEEDYREEFKAQDEVMGRQRPVHYDTKYEYTEVNRLKRTEGDILASPIFHAIAQKGSILVARESLKKKKLPKQITVELYSLTDQEGYFYIKSEKSKFKVLPKYVERIETISDLYDEPKKFTPVTEDQVIRPSNDELVFGTLASIDLGLTRPNFIRDILGVTSHLVETYRYKIRAEFQVAPNFRLGAEGELEALTSGGLNEIGGYTSETYSLGPIFKWQGFSLSNQHYSLVTSLKQSLSSTLESEIEGIENDFRLRTTSLTLGIEFDSKDFKDEFVVGFEARRNWTQVTSSTRDFVQRDTGLNDDSIVFKAGYFISW